MNRRLPFCFVLAICLAPLFVEAKTLHVLLVEASPSMNSSSVGKPATEEEKYSASDELGRTRIRREIDEFLEYVITSSSEPGGLMVVMMRFPLERNRAYYGPFDFLERIHLSYKHGAAGSTSNLYYLLLGLIEKKFFDATIPTWETTRHERLRGSRRNNALQAFGQRIRRILDGADDEYGAIKLHVALQSNVGLDRDQWREFFRILYLTPKVFGCSLRLCGGNWDLKKNCQEMADGGLDGWTCTRVDEKTETLILMPAKSTVVDYPAKEGPAWVPVVGYLWENVKRRDPPDADLGVSLESNKGKAGLFSVGDAVSALLEDGVSLADDGFSVRLKKRFGVVRVPVKGYVQTVEQALLVKAANPKDKRSKKAQVKMLLGETGGLAEGIRVVGTAETRPSNKLQVQVLPGCHGVDIEAKKLVNREIKIGQVSLENGSWSDVQSVHVIGEMEESGADTYVSTLSTGDTGGRVLKDTSLTVSYKRQGKSDTDIRFSDGFVLSYDPDEIGECEVAYPPGIEIGDLASRVSVKPNGVVFSWEVSAGLPEVSVSVKNPVGNVPWLSETGEKVTVASLEPDLTTLGEREVPQFALELEDALHGPFDVEGRMEFEGGGLSTLTSGSLAGDTVKATVHPDPAQGPGAHGCQLSLAPDNYPAVRIRFADGAVMVVKRDGPIAIETTFVQQPAVVHAFLKDVSDADASRLNSITAGLFIDYPEWARMEGARAKLQVAGALLDGTEFSVECAAFLFVLPNGQPAPRHCGSVGPSFEFPFATGFAGGLVVNVEQFDSVFRTGRVELEWRLATRMPAALPETPVTILNASGNHESNLAFDTPTNRREKAVSILVWLLVLLVCWTIARYRLFMSHEQAFWRLSKQTDRQRMEVEQEVLSIPSLLEERRCRLFFYKDYPDDLIREMVALGNALDASLAFAHMLTTEMPDDYFRSNGVEPVRMGLARRWRWYRNSGRPWKQSVVLAHEAAAAYVDSVHGVCRLMDEIGRGNTALEAYASASRRMQTRLYKWVLSSHIFAIRQLVIRSTRFRERFGKRYEVGQFWLSSLSDNRQEGSFPRLYGKFLLWRVLKLGKTHWLTPLRPVRRVLTHTCSGRTYIRFWAVGQLVRVVDRIEKWRDQKA